MSKAKFWGINPGSCSSVPHGRGDWMHLHAAGCTDIKRYVGDVRGEVAGFPVAGETIDEALADLCSDFISEGSMTLESAREDVTIHPCCEKVAKAKKRRK